jgi:curli biogenesis system outer membrane secretion channel CsgG
MNHRMVLKWILAILVLEASAATASPPDSTVQDWHAYIEDERERVDLSRLEELNNGELARLKFTAGRGPRPTIAIAPVQSALPGSSSTHIDTSVPYWYWYGWGGYPEIVGYDGGQLPVGDIGSIVTAALQNTRRFRVVERGDISQLLAEQDMGQGGRVSSGSAPKLGQLLGAQYLVLVSVNAWNPAASSKGLGLGGVTGKFLGAGNVKTSKAKVEMTFRVVDAETGEIVDPVVRSKGESGGFRLDAGAVGWTGPLLAGMGHLGKDPDAAAAVVACVSRAVFRIASELDARPWRSSIAMVRDGRIVVRGGEDVGLASGITLVAYSKGEAITDDDGKVLAYDSVECGRLRISSVQEKISIAVIEAGCDSLRAGDLVREAGTD